LRSRRAPLPPQDQDFVTAASESDAITPAAREMPGVHAGAIIFLGIAAANIGNYTFHFIAARTLGPGPYGDVASLVALAGLISLPLGGVQILVARRVAANAAAARIPEIQVFARRSVVLAALVGLALALAIGATSPFLARWLEIDSVAAVGLTAALAAPALLTPALWGLAQGLQRFHALAVAMGASPLFRIAAVAVLLAAGFGVAGAMAATLIAAIVGIIVPAWALRLWLRKPSTPASVAPTRGATAREFVPVVLGLLAITSLTTIDVVVAKAAFDSDEAGIYASASLVGRVILYLPAAIVTVLLPKVSSRVAAGREARAILTGSVAITIGLCLAATILYTVAAPLVTRAAFGSGYADVAELLPLFALAMTGYALLNVLLAYHLGHGSSSMSYLLAVGALMQLGAFVLFNDSPQTLLAVSICVAAGLLAAHELLIDSSLGHVGRAAFRLRVRTAERDVAP
jgi:O-antigen/teichoic acid export membrane protein